MVDVGRSRMDRVEPYFDLVRVSDLGWPHEAS